VAQHYPHTVTVKDNLLLDRPCTIQEALVALKSFSKDKSLGLDGWIIEFYLHFFDLVGPELLELVEESILHGRISQALKSTLLTLIPK